MDNWQMHQPKSRDDILVALLLGIGLLFPTSIGGEIHQFLLGIAFLLFMLLVAILVWRHGVRQGAVTRFALPILMILTLGTIISNQLRFGFGIVAQYVGLAAMLSLNLRDINLGPIAKRVFLFANMLWIGVDISVVFGIERISDVLVSWYSQFYPELLPTMIDFHRPVFTFATHSFAGLFTYLFFWLNWENYKIRAEKTALFFAMCQFFLLLAIASYTAAAFAVVAVVQIGLWSWQRNRRVLLAGFTCIGAILYFARNLLADEIELLWKNPQVAAVVFNPDTSGLLVRYGSGGVLNVNLHYIWEHPFMPIGFTFPSASLFLSDSGPIEYLLRGSILLLFLIYAAFYSFLRFNAVRREYAIAVFFFFLAFEVGLGALPYFRTQFLLPFIVVYLNYLAASDKDRIAVQTANVP